jgi:hypothetical protein
MNQQLTLPVSSFGRVRQMIRTDAESMLNTLSARQHLHPHDALASALAFLAKEHNLGEQRVHASLKGTDIPLDTAIGRLKRVELTRIARLVARHLGLVVDCDRIPD